LREALEKLQLNDAALKVEFLSYLSNHHTVTNELTSYILFISYIEVWVSGHLSLGPNFDILNCQNRKRSNIVNRWKCRCMCAMILMCVVVWHMHNNLCPTGPGHAIPYFAVLNWHTRSSVFTVLNWHTRSVCLYV
jgi:hypothetical protein